MTSRATLQLTLHGGVTFTADITPGTLELAEDPTSQQLTTITWDTPPDARQRLAYVNPAEVVAAVVYDPDDGDEGEL